MMLERLRITLMFLLLGAAAHGQVLPFDTYDISQGMLSNFTTALCQDSRGYLWVGTSEGISVFDGISFVNYTPVDGLPSAFVSSIAEDRSAPGTMWIGTRAGLCTFANGVFTRVSLDNENSDRYITALRQDSRGDWWCATVSYLFRISHGLAQRVAPTDLFGTVLDVQETRDGNVWIASAHGLFFCPQGRPQPISIRELDQSLPHVNSIMAVSDGALWVAVGNGDLWKVRDTSIERHCSTGLVYPNILCDDRRGGLWCSSANYLYRLPIATIDEGQALRLSPVNGLVREPVVVGLCDNEDELWFGTFHLGIVRLANRTTLRFPETVGEQVPGNTNAALDPRGHAWVVRHDTLSEVWRDESSEWHLAIHSVHAHLRPNNLAMVAIAPDGSLWTAGSHAELTRYAIIESPGGASTLQQKEIIPEISAYSSFDVLCFMVAPEGDIYLSIADVGVLHYGAAPAHPLIERLTSDDVLPDNSVRIIYRDREGAIWFGGYNLGLTRMRANPEGQREVKRFSVVDGLPGNEVRALWEDGQQRLWIGTRYSGLCVYTNGEFKTISVRDGLLSNGVWALSGSDEGVVLVASQMGLQMLRADASLRLHWNSISYGFSMFACGSNATGLFYGCAREGLVVYDPEVGASMPEPVTPHLATLTLTVNGKLQNAQSGLRFAYDQNNCTINYVAISLRNGTGVRYQYRLEPVDGEWSAPTSNRSVNFAALKPGTYTIWVRALTTEGIVAGVPSTMTFVIVPPVWQTWWFISLALVFAVGAIALGVQFRIRRLVQIERIRARIATDLHDDIGSGLTRIAILSEIAARQIATMQARGVESELPIVRNAERTPGGTVNRVAAIARELVDTMTDVVWSIDPKHDDAVSLVRRIRMFAQELCEARDIALTLRAEASIDGIALNPDVRRNLLSVAKEALTNIMKHAECTTVGISLSHRGNRVILEITDNGRGFDVDERSGAGNGLGNMKKRMQRSGGTLEIKSISNAGTTVTASAAT